MYRTVMITYQTRSEARFWEKKKKKKCHVPYRSLSLLASKFLFTRTRGVRAHIKPLIYFHLTQFVPRYQVMEVVPQWALSSSRRLNDVARGPTTSELGTFIENESHVYMYIRICSHRRTHSFSHNASVKNNTYSFFSLPPSSSLSFFFSLAEKHPLSPVVPIIKNTRDIPRGQKR